MNLSVNAIRCAMAALVLAHAGMAAAFEVSALPDADGVGLRVHGEVFRYDGEGRLNERREDPLALSGVGPELPGEPLFWALPATDAGEAVLLGAASVNAPTCQRVRLEDGSMVRLLRVLPRGATVRSGALLRARVGLDAAYMSGVVARGRDGNLLVAAPDALQRPTALQFAADCAVLAAPLDRVHAVAAHPEVEGGWLVRRDPELGFVLERHLRGERLLQRAVPRTSLPFEEPEIWLHALSDGGVLVARGAGLTLLERFDAGAGFRAAAVLEGAGPAVIREHGDALLLALRERAEDSGASRLVELDGDLQVRSQLQLRDMYVHGALPSAMSGPESAPLLVADSPRVLSLNPPTWLASPATGLGVLAPGPRLALQLAPSQRRPRLQLADGRVLATEQTVDALQLLLLSPHSELPVSAPSLVPRALDWIPELEALSHSRGLVLRLATDEDHLLRALDAEGGLRWQRSLRVQDGRSDEPGITTLLRGDQADRACVAKRQRVPVCFTGMCGHYSIELRCFRIDDGEPLPLIEVGGGGELSRNPPALFGSVGPDGTIVVYDALWRGHPAFAWEIKQTRILSDGAVATRSFALPFISPSSPPEASQWLQRERGDVVLLDSSDVESQSASVRLRLFDPSGDELAAALPGEPAGWARLLGFADDGEILLQAASAQARAPVGFFQLRAFSSNLQLRWQLRWADSRDPSDPLTFDLTLLGRPVSFGLSSNALGPPHAARVPGGAFWAIARDARELLLLEAVTGEHRLLFTPPTSGMVGDQPGLLLRPSGSADELLLLRTDAQGLELRRLLPDARRVGPPARIDSLRVADKRVRGLAQVGDRLLLGPLQPGAELRELQAPPLAAESPLEAVHAGLWYDPQINGQGLLIDIAADAGRWFAAWFTFDGSGVGGWAPGSERRLAWYTALGQAQAPAVPLPIDGLLFATAGGDFAGGATPLTRVIGSAELRALDCNTLEFSYRIEDGIASTSTIGSRRLIRLGPPPPACGGPAMPDAHGLSRASSGSWLLDGRLSQGILMQVQPGPEGSVWGAWFGFDPATHPNERRQHWLTLVGTAVPGEPGVVELQWMRTLGGGFDSVPTDNTTVIGRGRLQFSACDRATLDYSFDSPGLAGDLFYGLEGRLQLRRFDPCE
ncbi:MAG: hypothetical protein MEQ07_00775 [Aquimonas sp.]|nr:hypothetical protein [Aquimonas sp.]